MPHNIKHQGPPRYHLLVVFYVSARVPCPPLAIFLLSVVGMFPFILLKTPFVVPTCLLNKESNHLREEHKTHSLSAGMNTYVLPYA